MTLDARNLKRVAFETLLSVSNTSPDGDLIQASLAFVLWIGLLVIATWPVLAPQRWPLSGKGWSVWRLQWIFLVICSLALLVWRAPELRFNAPYDVDESQFLSMAQRFTTDPVAWRSADGVTAGPLDCYVLTWPAPLGLPLDYFAARLTGLACLVVTLIFLLKSVSLIAGKRHSLLLVLSVVTFYCFASSIDFVHYSSEHLPVALLSAAGWFLLILWRRPDWKSALALGTCLGAVPLAKLQAAPMAVYLFLVALAIVLVSARSRIAKSPDRLHIVLALSGGALIIPSLILLPVIGTGTWSDFFRRYLLNGVRYGRGMIFPNEVSYFGIASTFLKQPAFILGPLLFGFSVIIILLRALLRRGPIDRKWLIGVGLLGGNLLVTAFVILKPHLPFYHYLLLLPCSLLLFAAWSLRGTLSICRPSDIRRFYLVLPTLFFFICIVPQLMLFVHQFPYRPKLSSRAPADPVTPAIKALTQPGDTLAIWGWTPKYFISTGLHSATRDVIGFCVLMPGSDFDYYREAFLHDLESAKPKVFIDTSAAGIQEELYPNGWPHPAEAARYTSYPALAAYIDSHYHMESELTPSAESGPIFIFVKNE